MQYIYIVYSYRSLYHRSPKMIIGTYFNIKEAEKRQKTIGDPPFIETINGAITSSDGYTNFINKIPFGDCNIELFTNVRT